MSTATPKRKRTLLYVLIGVFLLLIVAAVVKARQKPKGIEVTAEGKLLNVQSTKLLAPVAKFFLKMES